MSEANDGNGTAIDESLYSRQLYVMGHDAQRRMQNSRVLIVGLDGLGVETAKNVILAGVKSVGLLDNTTTSYTDLASQFYLSEADIGKPRAEACASKLSELNPYVPVSVVSGELTKETVAGYRVVVMIDVPSKQHIEIADYCHEKDICVIVSESWGVFGRIFCDFGNNFICYDVNGENAATSLVASISNDEKALVTCLEDTRHGLEDGDTVLIDGVEGMPEINGREYLVTVKDPFSFEISQDTTNFDAYVRGGTISQVKKPTYISFDSMSTSLPQPGMFVTDWGKLDRVGVLHLVFQACGMFRDQNGALPRPGNAEDAQRLFDLTVELNNSLAENECKVTGEEISSQEMLIKRFAMCAQGRVGACTAMLGGIVGQEILKACSGKFYPIKQWFYYDAIETLSGDPLPEEEVAPCQSRYDGQIMVYGKATQERLEALKLFVVGAGAIGCEMLKNFAMMGIGCGSGTIHVTDMDHIEKSNLSRQFLFRNSDINNPKSAVACRAAKIMNPALNAISYENKVGPETEMIFNDSFYDSLDAVFTALDNVDARLYVDQRCIFYRKPMLESGTLGTKGSTQVVVPSLTEHYGAKRDPPEKSFAICTLAHFPRLVEHTLAWARDFFEEAFKQTADDVNAYLENPNFFQSLQNQQNMKLDTLNRILDSVVTSRPSNYTDCVIWARHKFQELFVNKIKQLLHNFPLDKQIKSNGGSGPAVPFWSGAKKPPSPLQFDADEPLHMDFIKTCAKLRATSFGLQVQEDDTAIKTILSSVQVSEFTPVDGLVIPSTDEEAKTNDASTAASMDVDKQCSLVMDSLPSPESLRNSGFTLASLDFDKDNDAQMLFITACSNCRARNYGIGEANLHQSRGIAGKITPAIATTTALVTGAICLELFKVLKGCPIEQMFNSFCNLALPVFTHEEPLPPEYTTSVIKGEETKFSIWDRIEIDDPNMTLNGLIDYLEESKGLELSMLSSGVSILYSDFMDRKKVAERKNMTLKAITEQVTKKVIHESQKFIIFEIIVNDVDTLDEVEVPYLRVRV